MHWNYCWAEFPLISGILNKHGAEGVEELGQAQFAQLLQNVLQDMADALAEKHIVVIRNIKIVNGSKIRMVIYLNLILVMVICFDILPKMFTQCTGFFVSNCYLGIAEQW